MKLERRRGHRVIAGMLAGALALSIAPLTGLSPAGAADPLPPVADPTAAGAFCQSAPTTNPFTDLGQESAATRQVILCLVATGLTSGTTSNTYTPGGTVTRRQMALFIKRVADLMESLETGKPDFPKLPAYDNVPDYTDVAAEDRAFQEAIGQLSQANIVGGFPDGTFRPAEPVTRRQMAAFVNRLQNFLSGAPFSTTKDYFDDDNGDPGEKDLNALADKGIFQGDGRGNVFPGDNLTRRQMANILLRDAQVYFKAGSVKAPFTPAGQFQVAPTTLATLQFDQTRDFTATGLVDTVVYDIVLFKCASVKTDQSGKLSFMAQSAASPGNTKASTGAPSATVTAVNGDNTAPSKDGVAPASKQIAFTIKSASAECVRPVVFADGNDDDTLDINPVSHQPIDSFGIGGETDFVPAEVQSGPPVAGQVLLVGPDYAVVQPQPSGSGSGTVYFGGADKYYSRPSGPPSPLGAAAFFEKLSTGDSLYTCLEGGPPGGPYTAPGRTAANSFCLDDGSPGNPTNLVASTGSPASSAIDLNWSAPTTSTPPPSPAPADSFNIYLQRSTCQNATVAGLTKVGSVPATLTSFTATGLVGDATYCFVVTTVEEGDEGALAVDNDRQPPGSPEQNPQRNTSNNIVEKKTLQAPTIYNSEFRTDTDGSGAPDNKLNTDDVFRFFFSEPMSTTVTGGGTFTISDGQRSVDIVCGASPGPGHTAATCSLGDAGTAANEKNARLTITLRESTDEDGDANVDSTLKWKNAQGKATVVLTGTKDVKDDNDGLAPDLPRSTDLLID